MLTDNQLPRSTPEAQGISSSAILSFVDAVEAHIHELHSFMLLRHGSVVAEGWWSPYRAGSNHMLFSLSKSFTATAIGLAIEEKCLSVDDLVLSFFLEDAPEIVSENLAAMRVRDLLSMTTGHAEDTTAFMRASEDGNWKKAFFILPIVHQPGTFFLYNTGATYMLAAIVQKVSGMMLLDYLQPRLLEPLGIQDAWWEVSPEGINMGGFGLNVKTEDIARFMQLYLQKGTWNGRRILSEAWVDEATTYKISNGKDPKSDWAQGYAYQFWRCQHGAYRGDGAFGQFGIVMPEQDAVLAITSGLGDMQPVLDLVWEHLLSAMQDAPLPEDPAARDALTHRLSNLALLPPQGQASSPLAASVSGNIYKIEPNPIGLDTVSVHVVETTCMIALKSFFGDYQIACGNAAWNEGMIDFMERQWRYVASATWTANDTLTVVFRLTETPFYFTIVNHFTRNQVAIDAKLNTYFFPVNYSLVGQLQS